MNNFNNQKKISGSNIDKSNKSYSDISDLVKREILGVAVTSASAKDVLEYIFEKITRTTEKFYIVTPNPEILVKAQKDAGFKSILSHARISLCDGVGVVWASRLIGKPIQQRITGVDMMERLCEQAIEKPITVGFLGGRHRVAEKTAECLKKKYPGLKVSFAGEEWEQNSKFKIQNSKVQVKSKNLENKNYNLSPIPYNPIDILFVAFGFPKQEQWMAEHIGKVDVRVMMGVGGAFDYISGRVPRAPKMIRTIGLEWAYRLFKEPWRWKRQVALLDFVFLVLKKKFFNI